MFISCLSTAPAAPSLREKIRSIAADAHGKVAVASALPGSDLDGNLRPHAHPPMQSVFKFPLVLTVLHQVEIGKLSLAQPISFRPSDRILPHVYSPLQDQYPQGNVDIPLRRLAQLAVNASDNVAADILLRVIGGPRVVDDYLTSLGVTGFHLVDNEAAMHHDPALQYRNWFEPAGAVQLLQHLGLNSPLSPAHTTMLLGWMSGTAVEDRLPGDLPPGTRVVHKTGSSDTVNGVTAATNDIGLVTLPDGRQLAVAVFVTDAHADDATRARVIARIARALYDAALHAPSAR